MKLWIIIFVLAVVLPSVLTTGIGKSKKRGRGSMWWGIAKTGTQNKHLSMGMTPSQVNTAIFNTLRPKQRKLVTENPGILAAIAQGVDEAIRECQNQFKNRRWNCSTTSFLRGRNIFGKIVESGSRETAFIYAITSASVIYSISKACSEGTLQSCSCDYSHQSNAISDKRDWVWGGCSDNIDYGFQFSREFVDVGERSRNIREIMNLHNNEAGRAHVKERMFRKCKCHGMSGSCSVKTCWMHLPEFRVIGENLLERYDGSSRVMASSSRIRNKNAIATNKASRSNDVRKPRRARYDSSQLKPIKSDHKPPGPMDLVYYEPSPNFCEKNTKIGILGTHGRQCNDTSIGVDGCDLMCCGRGFETEEKVVIERCNCLFQWCCEVRCQTCRIRRTIHTCL